MKKKVYSGMVKSGELLFNYGTVYITFTDNSVKKIPVDLKTNCTISIQQANGKDYLDVIVKGERIFVCDMSYVVSVYRNFY